MEPNDLIDAIQEVRRQNNQNWMDLVRLALRAAPDDARAIFARIVAADRQILALSERLSQPSSEDSGSSREPRRTLGSQGLRRLLKQSRKIRNR